MISRQRQLAELLQSLLQPADLRQLLVDVGGRNLANGLPEGASRSAQAFEAVAALESWGYLDDVWPRLRELRPNRASDIDTVAAAWGQVAAEGDSWLTFSELCQLANLAQVDTIRAGRNALFTRIPSDVRESIPSAPNPSAQVLNDLDALNRLGEREGAAWIERWIENARVLTAQEPRRSAGFDYFLACVTSRRPLKEGLPWSVLGRSDNLFLRGWARFSRPLRLTLALASGIVREEIHRGADPLKAELPTSFFFAALRVLEPVPVQAVLAEIPPEALWEPKLEGANGWKGEVVRSLRLDPDLLLAPPRPSSCLTDAITRLLARVPPEQEIRPADLFLDVGKYGVGDSVKRLRSHGLTPEKLDALAQKVGFKPM